MMKARVSGLVWMIALLLASAGSRAAQSTSDSQVDATQRPDELEEIIVTAQKREEAAQSVPLAVTALDADALARMGFTNLSDLTEKIPSLSIQPYPNSSSTLVIHMRGVGQGDALQFSRDPGVGIYLDDVYLAHGQGAVTDLGDVERVEVLRGPQGTLYGRNTIGGAVKFVTAKPTGEWGFGETLDVGNFGRLRSLTTVNFPTFAKIKSKLTYLNANEDGWVRNSGAGGDFGRLREEGYRAAFRWEPFDSVLVDYSYDHTNHHGTGLYQQETEPFFRAFYPWAAPVFPKRLDSAWRPVDLRQKDNFVQSGHTLTAALSLTPTITVKSISAYRRIESDQLHDTVEAFNIPAVQGQTGRDRQFSQEILLTGSAREDRIHYNLGLYYAREVGRQAFLELDNPFALVVNPDDPYYAFRPPTLADIGPPTLGDIVNTSKAAYGQITWTPPILADRLRFDLGARTTRDTRRLARTQTGTPFAESSDSYSSFDPSATVDYRWATDVHTYVRYATAYRAGGFTLNSTFLSPFGPEHLKSYELGLKSEWWDRKARVNVAAFRQNYDDIQLDFFSPDFTTVVTVNSGAARVEGVEVDMAVRPVRGLTWTTALAYLTSSASVTDPFLGSSTPADSLPNMPRWKGTVQAEYEFAHVPLGDFSLQSSYDYVGSEGNDISDNSLSANLRPAYGLLGARLTLARDDARGGQLKISVWGDNLANKEYQSVRIYGAAIFGQPRSYGVTMSYRFAPRPGG